MPAAALPCSAQPCGRPRAYTDHLCAEHGERVAIVADGCRISHAEAEAIVTQPKQQKLAQ